MFSPGNRHGLLLYDHPSSPCARRVRITLLEKALVWDTQTIDLSRLEQRSPEYLSLNPNGFVPTLAHGERVLFESNVITEYLDDVFHATPLLPDDPWERAQVKLWQSRELEMAKDYRPLMYQRLLGPVVRLTRTLDEALDAARSSTSDAADLAWEERVWRLDVLTPDEERGVEERLTDWLTRLEAALAGRSWLVGERFGQAEVSLYPRVFMLPLVGVCIDPGRFPHVTSWMARLATRPSFAKTLSQADAGLVRSAAASCPGWRARCDDPTPRFASTSARGSHCFAAGCGARCAAASRRPDRVARCDAPRVARSRRSHCRRALSQHHQPPTTSRSCNQMRASRYGITRWRHTLAVFAGCSTRSEWRTSA